MKSHNFLHVPDVLVSSHCTHMLTVHCSESLEGREKPFLCSSLICGFLVVVVVVVSFYSLAQCFGSIFVFLEIKIFCHNMFSYNLIHGGVCSLNIFIFQALIMTYRFYARCLSARNTCPSPMPPVPSPCLVSALHIIL